MKPWELLWLRFDSHDLPQLCSMLSIHKAPVFRKLHVRNVKLVFRRFLALMKHHPLAMEAILHAQMASLLAELFWSRLKSPAESGDSAQIFSPQIERAFTRMKLYSHQPWQVEELARVAGMSPPNFYRRFKQATGSSPIDWLRRERISQAKRHLIETTDAVGDIANRVGYSDPFYFSRDFKRMTGRTPVEFRRQEQHHS